MCLRSWLAIYRSDDEAVQWGHITDPYIIEAATWFVTYLAVDTVIVLIHGLGGRDIAVHHTIFFACYALAPSSSAPLVTGVLIGQELSTPFLNSFLLLRGFKGMGSAATQTMFVGFALAFYGVRVFLNTYVTGLLWLQVYEVVRLGKPAYMVLSEPRRVPFLCARAGDWVRSTALLGGGDCQKGAARGQHKGQGHVNSACETQLSSVCKTYRTRYFIQLQGTRISTMNNLQKGSFS